MCSRMLALWGDELVVRTGNVIELRPTPSLRIDAWEFGAGAARGDESALDLYSAHFGGSALAYDDCIADERRRLEALWIDLATTALDTTAVDPLQLAEAAVSLDVTDTRFVQNLVTHLEANDRHAMAVALRAVSA